MDLGVAQFIGLAASSGAAAGVMNQLSKFLQDAITDRRKRRSQTKDLDHQRAMQREQLLHKTELQTRELDHQRQLQLEERQYQHELAQKEEFVEARADLLPRATALREFLRWWLADLYGAEVDYYLINYHQPATIKSAADALTALVQIADTHPLATVRQYADSLRISIDGTVNMPDSSGNTEPHFERLSAWIQRSTELVDAIRDPDYRPEEIAEKKRT